MSSTFGRNSTILQHFLSLPQGDKVQAEYIWISGNGFDLRCKTKTLPGAVKSLQDIPEWNFDGSSTEQAPGKDSEIWLVPVKFVPDPFRRGNNVLVLCECLKPSDMSCIPSNKRSAALTIFNNSKVVNEHPWYGMEQEYCLFEPDGVTLLGWPKGGYPRPQGPYYCSVGCRNAFGRDIVEAHYRACLYSGLTISGINAEVMAGQWEYQIGPVEGIDAGDQLWLSRYILKRIAESFNVMVSFNPKPIKGDWNGSGCHHNYSTQTMRQKGGYDAILDAIQKLKITHKEHMKVYGENHDRLTGKHETAKYNEFTFGVANRGASIRIPRQTYIDKMGYFEDRRPSSNCDPYEVTSILAKNTIL